MSLFDLYFFFKDGHKPGGSYLSGDECLKNATERNLSCMTDVAIRALMTGCYDLIGECNRTLDERDIPSSVVLDGLRQMARERS